MSAELRGCFVTGTDTGVGKTVVAAAIVARLRGLGAEVRAIKPLITGLEDPPDPDWPPDHELLARVAGCEPEQVILAGYGPAVSPHLAIELAGTAPPTLEWLADGVRAVARAGVRSPWWRGSAACSCRWAPTPTSATWPSSSASRS